MRFNDSALRVLVLAFNLLGGAADANTRQQWFTTGLNAGDLNACDTLRGNI